jgi:hypothetical protein
MAKRLLIRGGTESQNDDFVGAERELTIDTTNWSLRIHDGETAGGHSLSSTTSPVPSQTGNEGKYLTTDGSQLTWSDIVGATVSETEPEDPNTGDLWYDETGGRLHVYYDASWIDASPNGKVNAPTSSKGASGDTAGNWSADSNYYYYCAISYTNGTVDIWRRVQLTAGTW